MKAFSGTVERKGYGGLEGLKTKSANGTVMRVDQIRKESNDAGLRCFRKIPGGRA